MTLRLVIHCIITPNSPRRHSPLLRSRGRDIEEVLLEVVVGGKVVSARHLLRLRFVVDERSGFMTVMTMVVLRHRGMSIEMAVVVVVVVVDTEKLYLRLGSGSGESQAQL